MPNEFIARKGLVVSGSTNVSGSVTAFSFTGSFSGSHTGTFPYASLTGTPSGIVSSSTQVIANLPIGTVSSSGQVSYTGLANVPVGIVSSSTQFTSITAPFTGSFTGSFTGPLTGSIFGTASWATNAITASYALTGGSGGGGNSFVTFSVAGQSDVIADSSNDTLTLTAGSGITLTTNASTDTITITATAASPQAFNTDRYTFIGNGTTVNYNVVNSYALNSLLVSVDGLTYTPTDDYSISANTLTFVTPPPSQSNILVNALVNATTGVTGSFSGSFFGSITSASFATTSSFAVSASWAPGGAGTIGPASSGSLAVFNSSTTVSSSNIFQSGNAIGIGTVFPNAGLEIKANPISSQRALALSATDTNGPFMTFYDNTSVNEMDIGRSEIISAVGKNYDIMTYVARGLAFYTNNVYSPRLLISASGRVGIGTPSPGEQLHVQGNVSASTYTSSVVNAVGYLGTSSFAVSASWAPGGTGTGFPFSGSAIITGSLLISSSVTSLQVTGSTNLRDDVTVNGGTFFVDTTNNKVGISNTAPLAKLDIDAGTLQDVILGTSTRDSYVEIGVENLSSGPAASSDFVANNDLATEFGNFIDMGINSSTYAGSGAVGGPGDAYLYTTSSVGELHIGNTSPNATGNVRIFAGGFESDAVTRIFISSSGNIGIGVSSSLLNRLQVQGNISASSYTSSINNAVGYFGTSSWSTTSSIALNIPVGSILTASIGSGSLFNILEMSMAVSGTIPLPAGTTASLDLNRVNFFAVSASGTGTVNWRIINPPATSRVQSFIIEYINGGAVTNTWFTNTRWPGGTAPVLTSGTNPDLLGFITDDAGTNWRGVLLQRNSS